MTTTAAAEEEDSYIDYEAFLIPSFSAHAFANSLVIGTNDHSDPSLDLSTPLSRVLFDLQEIDTLIHTLTTSSAAPLLAFAAASTLASESVLAAVESQVEALRKGYERLQRDVGVRSRVAGEVVAAVERLHSVTGQLRELVRALVVARQLAVQMSEVETSSGALVRAAQSLREIRTGRVLADVDADVVLAQELRTLVFIPAEAVVVAKAREAVLAFEPFSATTVAEVGGGFGVGAARAGEMARGRAGAGALALFLLSEDSRAASLLVAVVRAVLNACINAGLATLTRSLTALTTLDRSVGEVAARCQNLVALQTLLGSIQLPEEEEGGEYGERSLLAPVLEHLDGSSLSGLFFRSVAAGLEPRVREVVARGGANARILRGAKERLRGSLRACVERGLGNVVTPNEQRAAEFEIAVMVGAAGVLGR